MEETFVVQSVKNYLQKTGWKIYGKVRPGYVVSEKFLPDVVAEDKYHNLMAVECKGSLDLNGLMGGIGQCVTYANYGANIICFAIPKDREKEGIELVRHLNIFGRGKVGLFIVNDNSYVDVIHEYKRFDLPKKYSKIKSIILQKLGYVADLRVEELGNILDFAFRNQGNYNNSREFIVLLEEKQREILPNRRKELPHRMITNFIVTINQLNLWDDNYFLNEEGKRLRFLYKHNKIEFKDRLAYLLLTDGNWLALLSLMHQVKLKREFKTRTEYSIELLKTLIKNEFLPPSKKIEAWANKLGDRYYRFLKEFNFITNNEKAYNVNWSRVVEVLRKW